MGRIACFAIAAAITACLAPAAMAKTLVYCAEGSPAGFDPALHTDPVTLDASSQALYNRLVEFRPGTTEVVPALAESWEISTDGREYTFHLRDGVKFHSTPTFTPSRDFNADDAVFSFERQRRADGPWRDYADGSWPWFEGMSLPTLIETIRKDDDRTVTFVLRQPYAPFIADLAMDFASIVSKEYADQLLAAGEPEKLDSEPVGTGPFRLVENRPGRSVGYTANADYWRAPPSLDSLVFEITPDSGVRFEKLKAGGCQMIPSPSPSDIAAIRDDAGLKLLQGRELALAYLGFNTTLAPFDAAASRLAVAEAIDKQAIVAEVFSGNGIAVDSILPAPMLGGTDEAAAPYDAASAKQAVAAAGLAGTPLRIWVLPGVRPYNPDPARMAEAIRGQLRAAGIDAEIVTSAPEDFAAASLASDRDGAVLHGWVSDNGDPDNLLTPLLGCEAVGIANRTAWCNARFGALLDEARATIDPSERARLYATAARIVAAEAPLVPIAVPLDTVAAVDAVEGFVVSPFGRHNFESVDLVGGD